jgi:quercetin dioxygenase-like cupin family protein
MEITEAAGSIAQLGPEDWFSGRVWMTELLPSGEPGGVQVLSVQFEPGARTAWHSHPQGQLLHITSGVGKVGSAGGEARQLRAGDTVRAAPGERHWHGATAEQPMTHLAIQSTGTEWYEKVADPG